MLGVYGWCALYWKIIPEYTIYYYGSGTWDRLTDGTVVYIVEQDLPF